MPMPPPLGRSLIPLPGESLPGFILRLSCRLQLPPARLAPLSGLLVFAPATRYCPDCLAGDGSPIQGAFGGPWRKIWHLPVVFACTLHRRLLEDRCPECGQVTHNHPGAPVPMLPAMRAAALHPCQCRTVLDAGRGRTLPACCGRRLDRTPALRPADPELITLQHKILGLLEPGGPAHTLSAGRPAAPARYFTDLQALALLACSTWPAIRHLSPSQETAEAIDRHVEALRQRTAGRQSRSRSSKVRATSGPPPTDAAASGGLAHIADRILLSDV